MQTTKELLENSIKLFEEAPTSLEAYKAISDFVETIYKMENYKDFINLLEKEADVINQEIADLRAYRNEFRERQNEVLHQLNTWVFFDILMGLHNAMKPENYGKMICGVYFNSFNPDDPMPEHHKKEYRLYLDKVYKKALPFLRSNEQKSVEIKFKSYNEETRILTVGDHKVLIAKRGGNNNAHEIMAYIFIDNKDKINDKFYYSEIALKRFEDEHYNPKNKYAYQPYSGACDRINDIIFKDTNGEVKDFLTFDYSTLGYIEVNPKYL